MSPTEFDLRAALRDGEGDELDAERVVAGARAYRARRRSRILSTAATVVCVAAVGGVVAGLVGTGGDTGHGSGLAGPATAPTGGPSGANGRTYGAGPVPRLNQPYNTTTLALPGCPAALPATKPPAGNSTGELLPAPIRSFVVCSYGSPQRTGGSATPTRLLVTGNEAVALAESLRTAATHPLGISCPAPSQSRTYSLAMIGVVAPGRTLPAITATFTLPACDVVVSSDTAVRYGWRPPPALLEQLGAAGSQPAQLPSSAVTPGRNEGSPVH